MCTPFCNFTLLRQNFTCKRAKIRRLRTRRNFWHSWKHQPRCEKAHWNGRLAIRFFSVSRVSGNRSRWLCRSDATKYRMQGNRSRMLCGRAHVYKLVNFSWPGCRESLPFSSSLFPLPFITLFYILIERLHRGTECSLARLADPPASALVKPQPFSSLLASVSSAKSASEKPSPPRPENSCPRNLASRPTIPPLFGEFSFNTFVTNMSGWVRVTDCQGLLSAKPNINSRLIGPCIHVTFVVAILHLK